MNIERMITDIGEAIDRRMEQTAPLFLGFAFLYFSSHVIVAMLKGWI